MDTIVGKNNKGAIVTIIDRSTDWLVMRKTAPWQRCKRGGQNDSTPVGTIPEMDEDRHHR